MIRPLNVSQNLAVAGDVNVAGGDITSSSNLRVYSSASTTVGSETSSTNYSGSDVTVSSSTWTGDITLKSKR